MATAPPQPATGPTGSGRSLPWARFVVVALLVVLDLWSKDAVFAWLDAGPEGVTYDGHGHMRVPLLGDWLAAMRSLNHGMAFGLFGDSQTILVIGRVIAVGVLSFLLWRVPRVASAAGVALVLVLAGALGNLYDNLFLGTVGGWLEGQEDLSFGAVRDWIDVYFGVWDWHFPTFNVADSCISVGAVLLFLFWGREGDAEHDGSAGGGGPRAGAGDGDPGTDPGAGASA